MDAEPTDPGLLPRSDAVRLHVESITEPLSGTPLLRVSASWNSLLLVDSLSLEIRYDGVCVSRVPIGSVMASDIPPCHLRLGAGTQIPSETGVRSIEAAIVGPRGEAVFPIATEAVPASTSPGFVRRALDSILHGEVFSPFRWRARISRWMEQAVRFRQRVADRFTKRRFAGLSTHDAYITNTALTPRMRLAMEDELRRSRRQPTFSILMPVYNVDPRWLRKAIGSVLAQVYPHWELCLADDASTRPDLLRYLDRLPNDPRIKLVRRSANGHICAATNSAADLATGEFVAFMDNDDALAPDALFSFADALCHQPNADVIYSDEDKLDALDHRYDPQFKPDWSPELLLSYNFVNHFTAIRRSIFESVGRFRLGFEGAQDHDLLLRITERTDRVHHVPRVLYHWRSLPSSTAASAGVKSYVHTASERAVAEALLRRGSSASLSKPPVATRLNLPIQQLEGPDRGPRVAILIHGPAQAAKRTLQALRTRTTYRDFTDYLVLESNSPAESLNQAAASRDEDFLLFLQAGAEPTESAWLSRLMAYAALDGVGLATGRFVNEHGTILSGGSVLGMRDGLGPAESFAGQPKNDVSYYFLAESARNLAAARGHCLLVRRDQFDRLGGFDARRYSRWLWDVDFCLRLRGRGLRIAYVPGAEFTLASQEQRPDPPSELLALKQAWGRQQDPYHSRNCGSRVPFQPASDSPLSLPAEARTPPVRVLAASPTFNAAEGAPRSLMDIVTGLERRGSVSTSIWSPLGGPAANELRRAGFSVLIAPGPAPRRFVDGQWTRQEYDSFQRFAQSLLRLEQPELVLVNTLLAFPIVEAAARLGIPTAWVLLESYSEAQLQALFPEFARRRIAMAFRMASRVVPVSHGTADRYRKLFVRSNCHVIHNGLAKAAFDKAVVTVSREQAVEAIGAPTGKKIVLAVGTICERKGQHTLVEAVARLVRTRSDFVCYLVGLREGVPYGDYVRHLVRRRKLEEFVHLVPETPDVRPYYRAADVFVNASHLEAYCLSILEAEAFGLPIVSTPCPGVLEQVVWGENALRFTASDADELATVLGSLLGDDGRRRAMGRESQAMFDLHLSDHEMLDRYESLILSAARGGPRSQRAYEPSRDPIAVRPAA